MPDPDDLDAIAADDALLDEVSTADDPAAALLDRLREEDR